MDKLIIPKAKMRLIEEDLDKAMIGIEGKTTPSRIGEVYLQWYQERGFKEAIGVIKALDNSSLFSFSRGRFLEWIEKAGLDELEKHFNTHEIMELFAD